MVGNSPSNVATERRLQIIRAWILDNVQSLGYERYDDLHVDRIDAGWKLRERWVDAGLEALQLAIDVRNRYSFQFTVALGCSLVTDGMPPGLPLETKQDLEVQLDWSPPSLYLFPEGKEPWVGISGSVTVLDKLAADVSNKNKAGSYVKNWYYIEFTQSEEYYRSVFVAG